MNDRANVRAQPNGMSGEGGDGRPRDDAGLPGRHLDADTLNALVDRALSAADEAPARAHLDACGVCRSIYLELSATQELLRALPAPLPRRSFGLGPEYARSNHTLWSRFANALLPALPALRAATFAVALLLAAVSLRNVLDDPASRGPVSDIPLIAETAPPASTQPTDQNTAALQTNQREQEDVPTSLPAPTEDAAARTTADGPPGSDGGEAAAPQATLPSDAGGDVDSPVEEGAPTSAADTPADDAEPPAEPAFDASEEPAETSDSDTFAGNTGPSETPVAPSSAEELGEPAIEADATDADVDAGAGTDLDAQESTTLQVDEGDENAALGGESDSAMAMMVEPAASPSPDETPTRTPSPTSTATVEPAESPSPETSLTVAPAVSPTPTPEPSASVATARTDGSDGWDIAQAILAVALVTLIVVLGIIALVRRRALH